MIKINTTTIVMLAVFFMVQFVVGIPPFMYNDGYGSEDFPLVDGPGLGDLDRVGDLTMADPSAYINNMNKRSCIRRGGRCDHRKDDCCSGGACRCNLWGTNCQCQRMGIFQKWG